MKRSEPTRKTCFVVLMAIACVTQPIACASPGKPRAGTIELSPAHIAAVNRQRRVVCNFDTNFGAPSIAKKLAGIDIKNLVKGYFSMIDSPGVQIDSVGWCWLDGNFANYPSEVLPVWELPGLKKWWSQGIDPVRIFDEETRKRGIESFWSYRINGTDMTLIQPLSKPLLKDEHPEWLLHAWKALGNPGYWNFAIPEVRDYKLRILREIAENYDFDGFEIDYARIPICLPLGHQWENRHHLTEFMREVRLMTQEIAKKRGRPLLVAARVPENLLACHFDGMDVETWARDRLVDIFFLGNRSLEVDIDGFRRITAGTDIKLYPCHDVHHASDGYEQPTIEILRGIFQNWWQQGADGIQTFNFTNWTAEGASAMGLDEKEWLPPSTYYDHPVWVTHRHAYRDMVSPENLRHKDKVFPVERRGGGHGTTVVPDPEFWTTPRWNSYLTNMFASLPERLGNDGQADTLLYIGVGDDVAAEAEQIQKITVAVLLSDPDAKDVAAEERLEVSHMASHDRPKAKRPNVPPRKGIEGLIELRLNNILLGPASVERGWVIFEADPNQFAVGENLVGLRVTKRPDARSELIVEMLEVRVDYR